jgi:tellurite resistance protein
MLPAKKLLTLMSIPIRLGGAAVLVFLAYQLPYLVLALLILTILAALGGLAASFVVRRAVRLRSRTKCVVCECHPLVIARICPQCHTPLLAATVAAMPPPVAEAVIESAIALAWASGEAATEERGYLNALLKASKLSEERREKLRQRIEDGAAIEALSLPVLTADEAKQVLKAAAALVTVDGSLVAQEDAAYRQLAEKLGVGDKSARSVLVQQRKLAWV